MGLGEPFVPASGRLGWAVSWKTGAVSPGSGPTSFQLSPTVLSPEEGGGVGNRLSLCSAFGQLKGTVGTGSRARENSGMLRAGF